MPNVLEWNHPQPDGLATAAIRALTEAKVVFNHVETQGTARRLVLKVLGVQPVVREEVEGPPLSVAFDAEGKPTRAADAFAQKSGVKVAQLKKKETARGPRLVLERETPVQKVLTEAVPAIIGGISFPKTMRWDSSGVRFARPVRWLLAFYGTKPLSCSYGLVRSAPETYPNRRLPQKPKKISSIKDYFSGLPGFKVQLESGLSDDPEHAKGFLPVKEKRNKLLQQLKTAAGVGGRLPDETTEEFQWLLDTVTFLAEEPVVAAGSFRPEYLELPPEVLQTSMAKHLKLFSVRERESDKLLPKFLAVLEGKPENPAVVMANVDRIIEARFTDARFFYKEDTKTPLQAKIPQLGKVSFHEKLGTVGERTHRLAALMRSIAHQAGLRIEGSDCERAAGLCKADLVTQMVREFPSLQGVIGGKYAEADGEPAEIARAIAEHYQPRAAKDPVPATSLGAVLGLADRVDTLTGYFGVGLKPTGSADPYGLRRQALGLVRILIEPPKLVSFVGLSFDTLFDLSIKSWGARITVEPKTLKREIRAFLRERFEWLVTREHPADRELVSAVLAAGDDDLADAWERLSLLRKFRDDTRDGRRKILEQAAKVAERTGRIVQSVKGMDLPALVDAAVLKDPLERDLWQAWSRLAPRLKEQLAQRDYEEATRSYSTLYPVVHAFFEKVFVMDEDMNLRRNRLALMKEIYQSLSVTFADLSRLAL